MSDTSTYWSVLYFLEPRRQIGRTPHVFSCRARSSSEADSKFHSAHPRLEPVWISEAPSARAAIAEYNEMAHGLLDFACMS